MVTIAAMTNRGRERPRPSARARLGGLWLDAKGDCNGDGLGPGVDDEDDDDDELVGLLPQRFVQVRSVVLSHTSPESTMLLPQRYMLTTPVVPNAKKAA